jgi:hypothetical protein
VTTIPSAKTIERAKARLARRFFALMTIAAVAFALVVAVHWLLGWWWK